MLVDEGTSATNFINRDHRMQELVSTKKEPVTLFIDKVSRLLIDYGVSTIPAIGGSGDYYDVADCVFRMVEYKPATDRRE
jgi:predicted ABC-class ATPase